MARPLVVLLLLVHVPTATIPGTRQRPLFLDAWDRMGKTAAGGTDAASMQHSDDPLLSSRTWAQTDLAQAITVATLHQMEPFFKRLESGSPVTVMALGSSITCFTGGCFGRYRRDGCVWDKY